MRAGNVGPGAARINVERPGRDLAAAFGRGSLGHGAAGGRPARLRDPARRGQGAFPRMLAGHPGRPAVGAPRDLPPGPRRGGGRVPRGPLGGRPAGSAGPGDILDGWGSALDGRWLQSMLEPDGAEVKIYHPLSALFTGRFRRNHRKILLVDGEVAFLWEGSTSPTSTARSVPGARPISPTRRPTGWTSPWRSARRRPVARGPASRGTPGRPRGAVQIHLSGIGGGRRSRPLPPLVRRGPVGHPRGPRLLPSRPALRPLHHRRRPAWSEGDATARGAQRRAAGPGGHHPPLPEARRGRRGDPEWTRSIDHAKVGIVDGEKVLVGSFNLDPLSLSNLESLVEIDDRGTAEAARRWFEERAARAAGVVGGGGAGRTGREGCSTAIGFAVARFTERVARILSGR